MNVNQICKELNLEILAGAEGLENQVCGGYVSDLLSDVMGQAKESQVWITLQTHKNIMAIASLKDLAAIILVNGLKADDDTIEQAEEEGIPVLSTPLSTFEISGRLYQLLKA